MEPDSLLARVVRHLALTGALLAGLVSVGCGLFTASCHVRSREATEVRMAHLASLDVKSIASDRMDDADVGRMVHLSGTARPDQPVTDPELGFTSDVLVLERNVSMFRWIETCRDRYDSRRKRDVPDCSYRKAWSTAHEAFKGEPNPAHVNPEPALTPGSLRFKSDWSIGVYRFQGWRLPEPPSQDLDPLDVGPTTLAGLPDAIRERARIDGGAIHVGDPATPQVGDLRVRFRARKDMTVSLVAERYQWGIQSHTMPDGREFFEARQGTHSAASLVGARPPPADSWRAHAFQASLVAIGLFLLYWPLHIWGRAIPGPPLLTGAGVLLFVPLALTALYGANLAREWWALDRRDAVLAALIAAGAAILLPAASVLRLLLATPVRTDVRVG